MRNSKNLVLIGLVALIAIFGITACGGDDGDNGGNGGGGNGGGGILDIEMVQIQGGTFTMGSPTTEANHQTNETEHSVTLTGFYMGKYSVTQAQYEKVMGNLPASLTSNNYGKGDNYPVYYVSWYDALVFCNKLSMKEDLLPAYSINGKTDPAEWGTVPTSSNATWNAVTIVANSTGYRLPTEAQWEYACRAGTTTAWSFGDSFVNLGNYAWYYVNSGSGTHEVGKKPANVWGLYDMHGNVWEWCWDWYASSYPSETSDPTGAVTGSNRVLRGGSWGSDAQFVRSAYRFSNPAPPDRSNGGGFRVVCPLSE